MGDKKMNGQIFNIEALNHLTLKEFGEKILDSLTENTDEFKEQAQGLIEKLFFEPTELDDLIDQFKAKITAKKTREKMIFMKRFSLKTR